MNFFRRPNVTDAARSTLADAARAFLESQPAAQPAELQDLLDHAHVHLRRQFSGPSDAQIQATVLAAWASVEGERSRAYVDLEASTPHLLMLVDTVAGVRRPIPVADLVRILGPRAAA